MVGIYILGKIMKFRVLLFFILINLFPILGVNIFCSDSYGGGSVQGSGTLIMGKVDDKEMSWILTCNHVVKDLRKVSTIIDGEGDEKKQVRY
ncbi:hypothetical protein LCGC14_2660580 [marine sediment metagenome]|uniref:Peptidase S1 domain-containing protein n=1 Tax=marine sediment metagenome TaxID=412755 RepID=A0A0F9AEE4_9ZZZZ